MLSELDFLSRHRWCTGTTPGSCTLRSLPVSEFYECGSSGATGKLASCSNDSHPRLLPAAASDLKATRKEKNGTLRLTSSSKLQLHSAIPNKATELKKVLPTCNASIPTHAIVTGRVLVSADTGMGQMQTLGRTKPQPIRRVPLLELHKLARTPSTTLPFRQASQRSSSRLLLSSDSGRTTRRYDNRRGYHTARPPPSSGIDGIDHRHSTSHRNCRRTNCDMYPQRPSMARSAASERRKEQHRSHIARSSGDHGNLPPI